MVAVQQGSEAWHQLRDGKVTGSRVGAILGHNPYQKPDAVMREMVRAHFGAEREFAGNEATAHGHIKEPEARSFYEVLTGTQVDETDMIQHPEHDWIGVSPDGLVGIDGGLEIKCPYWAKRPYTMKQKQYYYDQVQLFIWTAGIEWCDFLCYFSPDKYHLERVTLSQDWIKESLPVLEAFIQEYQAVIKSKKRAEKYLRDDTSNAEQVQDSRLTRLAELILEAQVLEEKLAPMTKEIRELRAAVGKDHGTCTNGVVLVKAVQKQGAVDWQRVAEAAMSVPGAKDVVGDLNNWRKEGTTAYSTALIKGDVE